MSDDLESRLSQIQQSLERVEQTEAQRKQHGDPLGNENGAKKQGHKAALGPEGIRAHVKRSDRPTPRASDGRKA